MSGIEEAMWTLTFIQANPVPINGPQGQQTGKLSWSPMIGTSHTIPMAGAILGREPVSKAGKDAQKERRFVVLAPAAPGIFSHVRREHVEVEVWDDGINIIPLETETATGKKEATKTFMNGNLITEACVAGKGSYVAFGNPGDKWIVEEEKICIFYEIHRFKANNAARVEVLEARQKRAAEELVEIRKTNARVEAFEASLRSSDDDAAGSASASAFDKRRRTEDGEQ